MGTSGPAMVGESYMSTCRPRTLKPVHIEIAKNKNSRGNSG